MKKFGIILVVILVALAIWIIAKTPKADENTVDPGDVSTGASGQFARLEENAIYVPDQPLRDEVLVKIAHLKDSGFVIIHRDEGGKPGPIIGVSRWLTAGGHQDLSIGTTERLGDGQRYYAMLHKDDGNGVFDPKDDVMVMSNVVSDEAIMMIFMADADAPDPEGVQVNF